MKVSTLDAVLWAAGFGLLTTLLGVLLARGRWKQFPIFTCWIAYLFVETAVQFVLFERGLIVWYDRVDRFTLWPDFALQLGVVVEIARIVLRPTGTWVRDARGHFIIGGVGGAVVAGILTWWIAPPVHGVLRWEIRGDLFTSLVICELFVLMSLTANRLGLGWRNHVMAIGQGLTGWSGVMLISNAAESYLGHSHYRDLEHLRIFAFLAAIFWISIQLWAAEPERQPISEDLQKYILALHRRVEYDLRRLDAGD